jgi:hypothetical protein
MLVTFLLLIIFIKWNKDTMLNCDFGDRKCDFNLRLYFLTLSCLGQIDPKHVLSWGLLGDLYQSRLPIKESLALMWESRGMSPNMISLMG